MTRLLTVLAAVAAIAALTPVAADAQSVPRTPWGAPDLQGVWDFRSLTPMERPDDLADTEVFTAEEAAEFSEESIRRRSRDNDTSGRVVPYNDFWFDEGTSVTTARTSLIVDPPNGRIPAMTSSAMKRREAAAMARKGTGAHEPTPGGFVEDLGPGHLQVRCILGFNSGPPLAPSAYNNNMQLLQTEDMVVLFAEMNHDARFVYLDDRPLPDSDIRQWHGVSRGHWDGDTLVVETRNFLRETNFQRGATTRHLTLTERLTRVGEGTLEYRVTVDDPTVWTTPWTYSVPMQHNDQPLYEYACHEGNYGIYNILAGAVGNDQQ